MADAGLRADGDLVKLLIFGKSGGDGKERKLGGESATGALRYLRDLVEGRRGRNLRHRS